MFSFIFQNFLILEGLIKNNMGTKTSTNGNLSSEY